MTEPRKPSSPSSFEVPDLELEVAPTRRAVEAPKPAANASSFQKGGAFDDDDALDFGAALDLDPDARPGDVYFGAEDAAPLVADKKAEPNTATVPWPTGLTSDRERLALDPIEIQVLAAYGQAPTNAYLMPSYAFRVWKRRGELRRLLAPANAELVSAERARDGVLVECARALRGEVENNERFGRIFADLKELERHAQEQGSALSSANSELASEQRAIDEELELLRTELTRQRVNEVDAERRHEAQRTETARAEAAQKRIQIELRGVTQLAEKRHGLGAPLPAPEAEQMSAIRERERALAPELDRAQAALLETERGLSTVHAELSRLTQIERQLERKRAAVGREFQGRIDVRSQWANESERKQHEAFAELGRSLLASRGSVPIPEEWRTALRLADDRVQERLERHEQLQRALDAYDKPRAQRGLRLALTAGGIVLLLIVIKIAL